MLSHKAQYSECLFMFLNKFHYVHLAIPGSSLSFALQFYFFSIDCKLPLREYNRIGINFDFTESLLNEFLHFSCIFAYSIQFEQIN